MNESSRVSTAIPTNKYVYAELELQPRADLSLSWKGNDDGGCCNEIASAT